MQVIDILESNSEATAGQIANLMGLTTGTFTAILNRLEKAGLVYRERDPQDGRRVIVRLAQSTDRGQEMGPLFASLGKTWEELAGKYDAEQKALLLEFLQRSNVLANEEIARLREAAGNEGILSAPLGGLESARLVFPTEVSRLSLRAGDLAGVLYQAHFEGPTPDVKIKEGVLTIRYPQRSWIPGKEDRVAEITLNTAIPWSIVIRSGGALISAELGSVDLLEMEARGAGSMFRIDLPVPSAMVPIQLSGSGSEFTVKRPLGIAARVHMKGFGSGITFDGQTSTNTNSGVWQSSNYESATRRYDIEMSGSGSMFTVSNG
jgi:DNA-binding MarR family transcriptional regulator